MHPADCPSWEYKHHPDYGSLAGRCIGIVASLRRGELEIDRGLRDTRPFHDTMFTGLTPDRCPYFAGHYRGESFRCLEHYYVNIPGDPRVGTPPNFVAFDLANFGDHILRAGLSAAAAAFTVPDSRLPPEDKLIHLVSFACRVLVEFLRIHPYANGNGHAGRLIVWFTLAKFGYWPKKWPLNTSPPYHQLIFDYRNGTHDPLERFVLDCITG